MGQPVEPFDPSEFINNAVTALTLNLDRMTGQAIAAMARDTKGQGFSIWVLVDDFSIKVCGALDESLERGQVQIKDLAGTVTLLEIAEPTLRFFTWLERNPQILKSDR